MLRLIDCTVLIAEDQAVRQGMAALLMESTKQLIVVDNGKDALEKLKTQSVDLAPFGHWPSAAHRPRRAG
jgi:CheY-like chemotaxis protein